MNDKSSSKSVLYEHHSAFGTQLVPCRIIRQIDSDVYQNNPWFKVLKTSVYYEIEFIDPVVIEHEIRVVHESTLTFPKNK